AVDWGFIPTNPAVAAKLKTVQSRKVVRFLADAEEARLRAAMFGRDRRLIQARAATNRRRSKAGAQTLEAIPLAGFYDHLSPLVLLAMNTGLRKGELLSLEWDDVALDRRVLSVRAESAKSGRARHVPLNAEALDALTRWRKQRPPGCKV